MTSPSPTPPTGVAGQQDSPPFPPEPVEELLRLLVKAGRAHQLYLPNNPVYKSAIDALRGAFSPIWEQTDELALKFTETEIRWFGQGVLDESSKSSDSLPWTFFKDGIREIQLSPGFEHEELAKLLDILQRVRKASPDEDDLLTMLWEADFAHLRYRYVDLGAEPAAALESAEPATPASPDAIVAAAHEPEQRSGVVNMQDFDATVYFLDDKELDYLRHEIEREYAADLRGNVIAMLYDIYEAQAVPEIREEVSQLVENLMLMLLSAGQFRSVAYLLAESQVAVQRGANVTEEQRERLGQLPERLSAAEPLRQLLQGLDEAADLPPQDALNALFEQLRPVALGTIFSLLPRLQNARIRPLVEQAADRLASSNTAELVRLITSGDRAVALESVRRAGAMKAPAAVVPMAKLLASSDDAGARQAAVQALTEIGTPGAMQALERSIEDDDREVRIAAVRALSAKGHRGVLSRIENVVKGKTIREADPTEKMAFFEAYGSMCGDGGVAFLDGLLNGKSMFGKREGPEMRACAAIALGRIGSTRARSSLQQCANEKDAVVRNAVSRAMRRGTGTIGVV